MISQFLAYFFKKHCYDQNSMPFKLGFNVNIASECRFVSFPDREIIPFIELLRVFKLS